MSDDAELRPLEDINAQGLAKGRIEALTDGIMAVAMTILVLDLKFDGDREDHRRRPPDPAPGGDRAHVHRVPR